MQIKLNINFKAGFLVLLFFFTLSSVAQVFRIDSVPPHHDGKSQDYGIYFPENWKYHKGDDTSWANPRFNDAGWTASPTNLDLTEIPEGTFENIGWFRLAVQIDSLYNGAPLALMVDQQGASEIYLDGKLVKEFGKISPKDFSKQERFNPKNVPVPIVFKGSGVHLLAVRYSHAKALEEYKKQNADVFGFKMKLGLLDDAIFFKYISSSITTSIFTFYFTFFFALAILHFALFMFYRANRSNLYYSVFAGAFACYFLFILLIMDFLLPDFTTSVGTLFPYLSDIYIPGLLAML